MDFRKESRGANATKAVDLVINFYDNSVVKKDDKVTAQYGEVWGHPDTELAKDQTNLALITQCTERDGKTQFNHSVPFYAPQLEAIKLAAGDNIAPLVDKEGVRRGTIYGVKADLMSTQREGKTIGFMPNTKTLAPSDKSVAEVGGKDIRSRIFAAMGVAKADREAAKAAGAPAVEAEAEVELEAQVEPELV